MEGDKVEFHNVERLLSQILQRQTFVSLNVCNVERLLSQISQRQTFVT
jgi:hypothetical protein